MLKTYFYACSADSQNKIAETLGASRNLMLFSEDGKTSETVVCDRPLPVLLALYKVRTLFCGGIGNCVNSLLESNRINVIAGCSGDCPDVVQNLIEGRLKQNPHFTCSDHGRTCGSCPGKF